MEMQNGQINRKVRIKNVSKIKTAIVIAIAVILVGALCSHFNYERRIANFVTQNETELIALAEEYLEKTEQKEITYRGTKIGGVFPAGEVVPFDRSICQLLWILLFPGRYSGIERRRGT